MDRATLAAYDKEAAAFAQDWHDQPAPRDLQEIVGQFLIKGGATADIGCGSGREVAWLNANGFPAEGFDASEGLLAEARARYPALRFARAELPELSGIAACSFDNVLCETVIMHLDHALIAPSVRRMLELVKRLYAAFDAALVRTELAAAELLLDTEVVSASSGKVIHRVIARKRN